MTFGLSVDPAVLPAFALAMVLVELTPGPNLAWLGLLGAARGRRAGFAAVAGITLGLAVWLLVTLLGLTQTPLFSPAGLEALRWAGVVYMLWLTWDALRPPRRPLAELPLRASPVVRGFAANLLNPKAAVFYIALLPGFIREAAGPVSAQILTLGLLHIGISVVIHSAAVLGAAEAAARLPAAWSTALRLALAAGLLASAAWLALLPLTGETAP